MSECPVTFGVDDAFGDAFSVEGGEFVGQDVVEKEWTSIGDGEAGRVGRERISGTIRRAERISIWMGGSELRELEIGWTEEWICNCCK